MPTGGTIIDHWDAVSSFTPNNWSGDAYYPVSNVNGTTVNPSVSTQTVINKESTVVDGVTIAILTTSSDHGFSVGDTVTVANVNSGADTTTRFDGTFVITGIYETTTFHYKTTGTAVSIGTVTGTVTKNLFKHMSFTLTPY